MQKLTHVAAILLHQSCQQAQHRLSRVADGLLAPIGRLGGVEQNALDALEVQAWQATATLLQFRDFHEAERASGNHQAAIEAHQEQELLDREAAVEAQEDASERVAPR